MNKIRVDMDCLHNVANELGKVGSSLRNASAQLKQIDISKAAGGDLKTSLSSIRFSLLDLTLADEVVEVLLKLIARSADKAAEKTDALMNRTRQTADEWNQAEHALMALISGEETGGASGNSPYASKAEALQALIEFLDGAIPPEEHSPIKRAEKTKNNWAVQIAGGAYSFITGDWENMFKTPGNKQQYLLDSLMSNFAVEGYEPINIDNFMEYLNSMIGLKTNGVDVVAAILSKLGIMSEADTGIMGNTAAIVGLVAGLADDAQESFFALLNAMSLLDQIDKSGALSAAQVYMESGDEDMQAVGRVVSELLNADAGERVAMLVGQGAGDFLADMSCTILYSGLMYGIGALAGPMGAVVTVPTSLLSMAADNAVDAGNLSKNENNLIFASDTAQTLYSEFQERLAECKANPTEENASRATAAYQAYQHAIANAYQASADVSSHLTLPDEAKRNAPGLYVMDALTDIDENAQAHVKSMESASEHNHNMAKIAGDVLQDYLNAP